MLGFSTFTETPFAQADASGTVFADCNTTLVQTGVGSITVTAEASSTLPSLVSTTTVTNNIVIEAGSQFNMPTVSASADVNSLTANIEVTISSVVSTLSISSLTPDAQANASISSIVGSFVNTNIDIQAKAAITIDSIVSEILTQEGFSLDGQNTDLIVSGKANTNTSSLLLSAFPEVPSSYVEYSITVYAFGGGNKYYVDSVRQQQLYLQEGQTYRFDQSNSSNSNHPLKFSTTSNGTHASGSEYTTGVVYVGTPGTPGAYTEITVATGTPKLYYYCINHSGMGGTAYTPSAGTITLTTTVVGGNPSNHPYYNAGSSNKYAIDGSTATEAVTLLLTEGTTFRFDQSDSSNSGHPLRFSIAPNGTHGGGSEYTTGVTTNGTPGSAGAYTEITVAEDAPTLYYYCTNHSSMGWSAKTPSLSLVSQVVIIASVKGFAPANSILSETNIAALEANGVANLNAPSILLSSGLTDFADEDAEAQVVLTSLRGSFTTVLSSPTAVQFPYQNFANDYSRQRTLFLVTADTNNTVHIPADPSNRTVFIQATASDAGNRTVKIAA